MAVPVTRRDVLLGALGSLTPLQPSWMALNLASKTECRDWPQYERPVCLGSLLKPFLSLAYGMTHSNFPSVTCQGFKSHCWYAHGHGSQDFVAALANSCNTYFLALAANLDRAALDSICFRCGLAVPDRGMSPDHLIGLSRGWAQSPRAVLHAFASLVDNRSEPDTQLLFLGLARCAQRGTARAAGFSCYAKTGTAPCSHLPPAAGDGFAIALYPRDQIRHILLVERHNVTGAVAAADLKRRLPFVT